MIAILKSFKNLCHLWICFYFLSVSRRGLPYSPPSHTMQSLLNVVHEGCYVVEQLNIVVSFKKMYTIFFFPESKLIYLGLA